MKTDAEWRFIGPEGRPILSVVVDADDPDVVYANTHDTNIFKSLDGATSWNRLTHGPRGTLVIADGVLVVWREGSGGVMFFRSTDGGLIWELTTTEADLEITDLEISAVDSMTYIAGSDNGVVMSTDGGITWTRFESFPINEFEPENHLPVTGFVIDFDDPSIFYAGTRQGIYRSTDFGESWLEANVGLDPDRSRIADIFPDPNNGSRLFSEAFGGSLYQSLDSAATWDPVVQPDGLIVDLEPDPVDELTIHAVLLRKGLFTTADGGQTWNQAASGIARFVSTLSLDRSHPGVLYAGTMEGVWKSTDRGASWSGRNQGLGVHNVTTVAVVPSDPPTVFAGTATGSIMRTTDSSEMRQGFVPLYSRGRIGSSVHSLCFSPNDPSILYGGQAYRVLRSLDSGATWTELDPQMQRLFEVFADPVDASIVYVTGYSDFPFTTGDPYWLQKGKNYGETWVDLWASPQHPVFEFAVDPSDNSILYGGGSDTGLIRSLNGGSNWTWLDGPFPISETTLDSLSAPPSDPPTVFAGHSSEGLLRSVDRGLSWTSASSGLPAGATPDVVAAPYGGSTLFTAVTRRVYCTTDNGTHWYTIGDRLPQSVNLLAVSATHPPALYAATGAGVHRFDEAICMPTPRRGGGRMRP